MSGGITISRERLHDALVMLWTIASTPTGIPQDDLLDARPGIRSATPDELRHTLAACSVGLDVLCHLLDPAEDVDAGASTKAVEDLARFVDDHGPCTACHRVYHADGLRICDGGEMVCPDCWAKHGTVEDPPAPSTTRAAEAAAVADPPAPPHDDAPAEPGPSAEAAGAASVAQGADPAPPAPPAQAVERLPPVPAATDAPPGDAAPKLGRQGDRASPVWTEARVALLRAEYPDTGATAGLHCRLNALDGLPITSLGAITKRACDLGIRIKPATLQRMLADRAAHARGARAAKQAAAQPVDDQPAAPAAAAPPSIDPPAASSSTAAAPAEPAEPAMQPEAPEPAQAAGGAIVADRPSYARDRGAVLPAVDPDKAEAFGLFDAGMTVRDAHADLGTPLSTLSNWHAEWKLRTKGESA